MVVSEATTGADDRWGIVINDEFEVTLSSPCKSSAFLRLNWDSSSESCQFEVLSNKT